MRIPAEGKVLPILGQITLVLTSVAGFALAAMTRARPQNGPLSSFPINFVQTNSNY